MLKGMNNTAIPAQYPHADQTWICVGGGIELTQAINM